MNTKSLFYSLATVLLVSCVDSVKEKEFEQDLPILSFTADSEFSQEGTAVLTFILSSVIQKEVVIHLEAKEESYSGYSDLPSSYITFPSSVIIRPGEKSSSVVVSIELLPIDGNLFQACFFINQVSNARIEDNSQKVFVSVDKLKFYFNTNVTIPGNNNTDVFVLSNLKEMPHIKGISEDGTMQFSESDLLEHIPVGSIICSGPVENAPNGYLYKVKSIHSEQGETIIQTEPASLDEAIKEGSINETLGILDYVDFVEDGSGNIIETSYTDTRTDFTTSLVIPIRAQFAESVGLTGSISLFGTTHFDLDISDWSVNKFEIWMESGVKIQTSLGMEMKGTVPIKNIKIATIYMRPITFIVAGVPVVITQKVEISINLSASGTITLGCELLDADIKYKAGIQYLRETGWDVISENTSSKPIFLNKHNIFDMEGELTLNLPQYSYIPALYGITTDDNKISENISFPVSIKVSDLSAVDITENYVNPKIKATWGAELETEAKVTILSKKIINYKSPTLKGEFTLLDKHLYPSFTIVDVDSKDADCADAIWKLIDEDDCFFKTYSDVGLYWRKGEWAVKVKNGTEQKKSLGGISLDSVISGRTYTHTITDLEPLTLYSARPYFVDGFGIEHLGNAFTFRTLSICPDENHPHAIDLGLSVKWACCNVGANVPEGKGNYYAWGETSSWTGSYKWYDYNECPEENRGYTKYNSTDGKVQLDISDDAARANWGGNWRMPTAIEMQEFISNCSFQYETINGIKGIICTSHLNDNSIFIPHAGFAGYDSSITYDKCYIFSSTLATGTQWFPGDAMIMSGSYGVVPKVSDFARSYGHSIRPVVE